MRTLLIAVIATALASCRTPDVALDEAEAFEYRLRLVLPADWTLAREFPLPPDPLRLDSQPRLEDLERAWVLATPWPGQPPQDAQIWLYLVREHVTVPGHLESLARWERFRILASDPAAMSIGGQALTWQTLPGWPTARTDLIRTFQ